MKFLFHCDDPKLADDGPEVDIQVKLRVRMKKIAPTVRLVAVPNGMRTTAWNAMKARREGMSSGFPDLIAFAKGRYLTAFLEIKARGGSLSPEQIDWLNFLYNAGFPCGCFRSVDTAVRFLREHGFPFIDEEVVAASDASGAFAGQRDHEVRT